MAIFWDDSGVSLKTELNEWGHNHYELNRPYREHHHHLVCVLCNRTLEFKDPFITGIGVKQAESEGYRLLDCQLTLYGTCPDCDLSNPSDLFDPGLAKQLPQPLHGG